MLGLIARRLKNSCNVLNLRSLQSVQNEVRRNVSTDEDHRHSPHEWRGLKNKNVIAETVDRQNVYHFIINGQHQKQKHYKCWDDWYQLYLVKLVSSKSNFQRLRSIFILGLFHRQPDSYAASMPVI